jgi:transposase
MRKHDTAGKSSVTRKTASRKLTVGIDLGDRSSRYCILDEQGEVLAEGSVATTKKGFAQYWDRNRGAE